MIAMPALPGAVESAYIVSSRNSFLLSDLVCKRLLRFLDSPGDFEEMAGRAVEIQTLRLATILSLR